MRKSFKKALSFVLSAAMLVSLGSGMTVSSVSAEEGKTEAAAEPTEAASKAGFYKAMIGFQTSDYDYRDHYGQLEADAKYAEWMKANGKEITDDYNGVNIYLNGNGPAVKKDGSLNTSKAEKAELYSGAIVTDAKMDKDGEYTVSIKNLNLVEKDDVDEFFNSLSIVTNYEATKSNVDQPDVKVTATSVKIAGEEIAKDVVLPQKADYYCGWGQYMLVSMSSPDDGTKDPAPMFCKTDDDSKKLMVPSGAFDIEITFTIEGVDWSKAPTEEAQPTATPTAAPTTGPVITPPPVQDLKTSFDIFLSANVNPALTPEDATDKVDAAGKKVQSAAFGSADMKAKVLAATTVNKNTQEVSKLFNEAESYYVESAESSATITKTGEYTLSVVAKADCEDFTAEGAIWFPVLINGSNSTMPTDFNIVGKSVTVGDKSYNWNSKLTQDSQNSVRVPVVNQWAQEEEKASNNTIAESVSVKKGDKMSFTFYVTTDAPAPVPTATPVAIKASSTYKGYLGFQTDDWLFRDPWNNSETGLNCKDYDYLKQVAWNHDGKTNPVNVTSITDATMDKNDVKYNISIKGLNVKSVSSASTKFNMLFISTDIPLSMKSVVVKDAVLKIDGNVVKEYAVVPNKGDASTYYQFMLADAYAPNDGTKDAAYPSGDELKVFPTDSIEVEYTITGVDFDRQDIGVKKGKTFTSGDFKYKVTKAATLSGDGTKTKGTVQVVGLSKKGKKKASVSLGATTKVTSAGAVAAGATAAAVATYKISKVKSGAFKNSSKLKKFSFKKATNVKALPSKAFYNCKKLTSVVLNKKMKKLPAGVFQGCKNLKSVTFNAKLTSVNKTAFKKCTKKIKIAGKSKAANKKKIKKVYKKVK